jgi:uncharacterized protein
MERGDEVIVQACHRDDDWFGYADVLRRIPGRSRLGGWSYEALDTKLARETRAGTILQLGLYSALLQAIQGTAPEHSTSSCRATLVATWFSTRTAPMTPRRTSASSRG